MFTNLSHVDLSHVDLPHVDLSHVNLSNVDLPHVDLSHVDLPNVDLPHVACISKQHVCLTECNLSFDTAVPILSKCAKVHVWQLSLV